MNTDFVICPYCEKHIKDLWDFDWRGNDSTQSLEIECPRCDKPIVLTCKTSYIYEISKREGKNMNKAIFIKQVQVTDMLDQRLYKLEPPYSVTAEVMDDDNGNINFSRYTKLHEYVVVSTTQLTSPVETYIFPADATGFIIDYIELPGSTRGTLSHIKVLTSIGYSL